MVGKQAAMNVLHNAGYPVSREALDALDVPGGFKANTNEWEFDPDALIAWAKAKAEPKTQTRPARKTRARKPRVSKRDG